MNFKAVVFNPAAVGLLFREGEHYMKNKKKLYKNLKKFIHPDYQTVTSN